MYTRRKRIIAASALLWAWVGVAGGVASHLINCGIHELRNCIYAIGSRNVVQPIGGEEENGSVDKDD